MLQIVCINIQSAGHFKPDLINISTGDTEEEDASHKRTPYM